MTCLGIEEDLASSALLIYQVTAMKIFLTVSLACYVPAMKHTYFCDFESYSEEIAEFLEKQVSGVTRMENAQKVVMSPAASKEEKKKELQCNGMSESSLSVLLLV